ncbi:hypothetical protein ACVWYH_002920 [Bradyrhizobium sp. GM24.11]
MGIAAVVLGASHREAITEAVELLGIDGKDRKSMLDQHLHDRAMRHLDRHCDLSRSSPGFLKQPIAQLRQPSAAMGEPMLSYSSSFGIQQANAMALRCPIDPDEPVHIFHHCCDLRVLKADHRDLDRSLYRRSRRMTLLLDLDRGRSAGALFLRRCSRHWWARLLPADRSARPVYINRLVSNPQKGTGWAKARNSRSVPTIP